MFRMKKLILSFTVLLLSGCVESNWASQTVCRTGVQEILDKLKTEAENTGIQVSYAITDGVMLKDKSGLNYRSWLFDVNMSFQNPLTSLFTSLLDISLEDHKREVQFYCVDPKEKNVYFVTENYTEFTQEVALRRVAVIDSIAQLFM